MSKFNKKIDTNFIYLMYQSILLNNRVKEKYLDILLNNKFKFIQKKDIILQNRQFIIDIPNEFIYEILNNQNKIMTFTNEEIHNLMKNSKHINNIKNIKFNDLDIALFRFDYYQQIDKFHYSIGIPKDMLLDFRNKFLQKIDIDCYGFYNETEGFLFLNSKYNKELLFKTCYHELSHFLQSKVNICLPKITKNVSLYISDISHLFTNNINILNQLNYWFSPKQIYPFINDLILNLKTVKEKFYQNISDQQFIKMFINKFSTKNKDILSDNFILQYKLANNIQDISCIVFFICSYILKIKYQKICNSLLKAFNCSIIEKGII